MLFRVQSDLPLNSVKLLLAGARCWRPSQPCRSFWKNSLNLTVGQTAANLPHSWRTSDGFLVHIWWISGEHLMDSWRRSTRVPLVSLRLGRAGRMGLLDGQRLWGAYTPAQGMDVPAKLLESVCSPNPQNPLDNIHFKRCTDLSFAWSGVMRWGLCSTTITKAGKKRIQWNFTYC